MIALQIIGWFICGFIHYGMWVGHFQNNYKLIADEYKESDRLWGVAGIIFGPIALFATLIICRPYSWKL